MFGKNETTRWADTINYLQTNFPGLGAHKMSGLESIDIESF